MGTGASGVRGERAGSVATSSRRTCRHSVASFDFCHLLDPCGVCHWKQGGLIEVSALALMEGGGLSVLTAQSSE